MIKIPLIPLLKGGRRNYYSTLLVGLFVSPGNKFPAILFAHQLNNLAPGQG